MKKHLILIIVAFAAIANSAIAQQPNAAPADDKAIALAPDWMPKKSLTAQEQLRALDFYSRPVANGPQPGKIIWNLQWLMPLREAETMLPGMERPQMGSPTYVKDPSFPQRSIFVKTYSGNFKADPPTAEVFTEAHLICDANLRLISVELTCNHPKIVSWAAADHPKNKKGGGKDAPGPDGNREPYYDFVTLKANASSGQAVFYQIRPGHPGVICVHTELVGKPQPDHMHKPGHKPGQPSHVKGPPPGPVAAHTGPVIENVRWYLTAPLARKLIEIAEANK